MKGNKKVGLGIVAIAGISSAVFLMNANEESQGYLPVTEQLAPASEALSPQDEVVEGVAGTYPKFLSMTDLVSGEVELPKNEVDIEQVYDAKAEAWAKVDMEEIRSKTPDSLFWAMAAPTEDATVLEARNTKREALKQVEAKMMARHASEAEIQDYYAYQMELSEDYIEVVTLLLNQYGSVLPEEDYSGQTLARSLHLRKLQELPQQMSRALNMRQDFLKTRELWLSDKEAYRAKLQAEADAANQALGNI